jgi:hypothetical protein
MLRPSQLVAAIDRRLLKLVQARARRRSIFFSLLPVWFLEPLLAPAAKQLRFRLLAGAFTLSISLLGAILWLVLGL